MTRREESLDVIRNVLNGAECYAICEKGSDKYHAFTALHTWANKLTGVLIFAAPILYCLCGLRFTGIILCAVAFASACEELIVTVKSKELNRDDKGILFGKSKFSGG